MGFLIFENIAFTYHASLHDRFSIDVFSSTYYLFQYKMALEQTVKELQAQHAQFQETLLNLAKGQQDIMALLAKKKKKTRKSVFILNMGRRFKGPAQRVSGMVVAVEMFKTKPLD